MDSVHTTARTGGMLRLCACCPVNGNHYQHTSMSQPKQLISSLNVNVTAPTRQSPGHDVDLEHLNGVPEQLLRGPSMYS